MSVQERSTFRARSVLVTGAGGFVGGWLVRDLLEKNARVVVLVRDESPFSELRRGGYLGRIMAVHGSLEDYDLLERVLFEYEIEAIFHLGAQTQVRTAHRQPLATMEANVRGTYNILEAGRRLGDGLKALVVASSDKAYGSSERLPYTESHPLAGRGIYDVSKSASDLIATAYASSYDMPVAIARCGNIYGGGDLNWDRIIPGTIRSLLDGERPAVRSDGTPLRDYLYVRDAVAAYIALGEAVLGGRHHGEAFNFGNGEPVSVLAIIDQLRTIVGRRDLEPVILGTAHAEIENQYLDSSLAARELGWRPGHSLAAGLEETVSWYRDVLAAMDA